VFVILGDFLAHSFVSLVASVLLEYFFFVFGSVTLVLVLAASRFGSCSDPVWPSLDSIPARGLWSCRSFFARGIQSASSLAAVNPAANFCSGYRPDLFPCSRFGFPVCMLTSGLEFSRARFSC
jgi:hypothetical protein